MKWFRENPWIWNCLTAVFLIVGGTLVWTFDAITGPLKLKIEGQEKLIIDVKESIEKLGDKLENKYNTLDSETDNKFTALRTEMNNGFAALRTEMNNGFAALRTEMNDRLGQIHNRVDSVFRMPNLNISGIAAKKSFDKKVVMTEEKRQ